MSSNSISVIPAHCRRRLPNKISDDNKGNCRLSTSKNLSGVFFRSCPLLRIESNKLLFRSLFFSADVFPVSIFFFFLGRRFLQEKRTRVGLIDYWFGTLRVEGGQQLCRYAPLKSWRICQKGNLFFFLSFFIPFGLDIYLFDSILFLGWAPPLPL